MIKMENAIAKDYCITAINKHFPNSDDLVSKIMSLQSNRRDDVRFALGKLDTALQICNFLRSLSNEKPSQDTDNIIITILVSCAEAIARMRYPKEINCQVLVEQFFEPVRDDLQYKIKGSLGDMPYETIFSPAEVLYLIRNDYIHNGNFVGLFFKRDDTEDGIPNGGTFWFAKKNNKTQLILADSKCKLTYDEFLRIFKKAFEENIRLYSQISQTV